MCSSSSLQYVTIFYPLQDIAQPIVYPPTLAVSNQVNCMVQRLAGILIRRVTLINSYYGISSSAQDGTPSQYFHVRPRNLAASFCNSIPSPQHARADAAGADTLHTAHSPHCTLH